MGNDETGIQSPDFYLNDIISEGDFAKSLGLKVQTLRSWRARKPAKGPPFINYGRKTFYRKTSVTEWLRSLERNP